MTHLLDPSHIKLLEQLRNSIQDQLKCKIGAAKAPLIHLRAPLINKGTRLTSEDSGGALLRIALVQNGASAQSCCSH